MSSFSFVWDKICEVFDGILVYYFHEGFYVGFWDFKVGKFINQVFVYSPSCSCCDSDEGVGFPAIVLYGVTTLRCTTLLCCAILRPLSMGVHMLIIGGAMCFCHCYGTVCSWVLMCEGP